MKFVSIKCPECGVSTEYIDENKYFHCTSCKTTLLTSILNNHTKDIDRENEISNLLNLCSEEMKSGHYKAVYDVSFKVLELDSSNFLGRLYNTLAETLDKEDSTNLFNYIERFREFEVSSEDADVAITLLCDHSSCTEGNIKVWKEIKDFAYKSCKDSVNKSIAESMYAFAIILNAQERIKNNREADISENDIKDQVYALKIPNTNEQKILLGKVIFKEFVTYKQSKKFWPYFSELVKNNDIDAEVIVSLMDQQKLFLNRTESNEEIKESRLLAFTGILVEDCSDEQREKILLLLNNIKSNIR